jgi:hypothetical protein
MKELMEGYVFRLFPLSAITPAISFDRGWSLTVLCLYRSFSLHPGYKAFRTSLGKCLELLDQPTLSTTGDESIDAALEVLRTERKREREVGEKDRDEMDDDIGASATDQGENVVKAD